MNHRSSGLAFAGRLGLLAMIAALAAAPARAGLITYDVNFTFDPNSTPTSTLGAAGPGTITGTFTIDTSIPLNTINLPPVTGAQNTNLVSADLLEASNNGTILSGFSNTTTQLFNNVTPYDITFLGGPVTIIPNSAHFTYVGAVLYEFVSFQSPPIIDSIQEGPSFQFDFAYPGGGSIIPGNFDSIASTGFNAYLYGTVTPALSVPEPSSLAMLGCGLLGLLGWRARLVARAAATRRQE